MDDLIKILIIDDNPEDRELIKSELGKVFIIETEEVINRRNLDEALKRWDFDIVITDNKLSWITGLDVLLMIKNRDPKLPVIMFTNSGDEETAVKAMKIGLDDYIIKSKEHYQRIPVAVNRIFHQISEQQEKEKMEAQLKENELRIKELMDNAVMGYYKTSPDGTIIYANNTLVKMLGYKSLEELQQRNLEESGFEPEYHRKYFKEKIEEQGAVYGLEATWLRKDGQHLYVRENARLVRDENGNISHYEGSVENITDIVQSHRINQIVQNLSKTIISDIPRDEFYEKLLQDIGQLIKPGDLYIAMYNENKDLLVIEKSSDENQVISKEVPDKRSIYYYLLENHDSLLINYDEFQSMSTKHNIVANGKFTQWMGARIKGKSAYLGVLVAIHRESGNYFSDLEQSMLEFIAAQIGLFIEKQKASDRLADAKKKAEISDQLKSHMLANVSHELHTPMNGIIGFAKMINDTENLSEQIRYFSNLILRNAQRLYQVLDNLVYLSRLESGELKTETSQVEVYTFLDSFFESFSETHQKSSVFYDLKKDRNFDQYIIHTDETLLNKVLENLTENAFNYTSEGKIRIGFDIDEYRKQIRFYISDTGIGIPIDSQFKIFQNFVTLEDPYDGQYSGSGLGLPLCYKILKKLGGSIWLDSQPGAGSTFYFALPLQSMSIPQKTTEDWSDKTVLIVEDDVTSYELLEAILLPFNLDLIWAKNGKSALKVFEQQRSIDLVLMDIFLPGMKGTDLIAHFKKIAKNTPVIAVTAYALDEVEKQCREAGTDAFVTKPIRKEELINQIMSFLKKTIDSSSSS
ncbi:MAG: response regulator [Bacteroidales bacterium]|nr:response regulator [Bacteroidales bacterium]MCF8334219.1 response regulator [Bacteroidales bacterium]